MFELEKSFRFEAAHILRHHTGKCGRHHGHSYLLTVRLRSENLIESGSSTNMVMDFADVNAIVQPMIEQYLDHHRLNDTLESDSPSTEFIARWAYRHLKPSLPNLYSVSVSETTSSGITYWE
ncbi:MAG: 6-carboxytetrahydropterin synthase QueD [Chlamydiales bacterium]|nr:6-carboxytetrahydropterin synthase QueD [Chlamydiales bacterium]